MAHRTRPQLASQPKMAAFVRVEAMTLLAMRSAGLLAAARWTHAGNEAAWRPRRRRPWRGPGGQHSAVRALQKSVIVALVLPVEFAALPAMPLARMHAHVVGGGIAVHADAVERYADGLMQGLVEHLRGEMAQSVVRKHSIVPMLGWIMPLPLEIAAQAHGLAAQVRIPPAHLLLLRCRWS